MHTTCDKLKRERDDAVYEAERLRDQMEAAERRERREQQEREEQRAQEQRRMHPSNRLYHGEITDFVEATEAHEAACRPEILSPSPDEGPELRDIILKCNETMRESIQQAQKARKIYCEIMASMKPRAIEALKAAGLTAWAECLEQNDYSSMAI